MKSGGIRKLLEKFIGDTLSPGEAHRLQQLLSEDAGSAAVEKELEEIFNEGVCDLPESRERQERLREKVFYKFKEESRGGEKEPASAHAPATAKTKPGEIKADSDMASLTLADGTVVA